MHTHTHTLLAENARLRAAMADMEERLKAFETRNRKLRSKLQRFRGRPDRGRGRPRKMTTEQIAQKFHALLTKAGERGMKRILLFSLVSGERHRKHEALATLPVRQSLGRGQGRPIVIHLIPNAHGEPNGS